MSNALRPLCKHFDQSEAVAVPPGIPVVAASFSPISSRSLSAGRLDFAPDPYYHTGRGRQIVKYAPQSVILARRKVSYES